MRRLWLRAPPYAFFNMSYLESSMVRVGYRRADQDFPPSRRSSQDKLQNLTVPLDGLNLEYLAIFGVPRRDGGRIFEPLD